MGIITQMDPFFPTSSIAHGNRPAGIQTDNITSYIITVPIEIDAVTNIAWNNICTIPEFSSNQAVMYFR